MFNYEFVTIKNKTNPDEQGYAFIRGNELLETLFYNADKISHKDLIEKKKAFFNFICSKYNDVDRRNLLLVFAYADDDMLVYYKSLYPIKERVTHGWIQCGCPQSTERYNKKLTEDEKVFVDVALAKFRERFGYNVAV